jgi:predicted  nucleic acid-binding Zn-ribbon protein
MTIEKLQETIAQQNRLISSQQLTIHELQRQNADNRSTINEMADRIKELEDQLAQVTV